MPLSGRGHAPSACTPGGTWHCACVTEGQEGSVLRVSDADLEFGPDLVMHYRGQPFTGIALGVMESGIRSELTYVDGLQHGPARDWDASGRLRAEDSWRANFRDGVG